MPHQSLSEMRPPQRPLSPEESQRLLHELQVHQTELKMQNDEILSVRLEVEAALERYADFYDFAPVGYLTLDDDGVIRAANLTAATMLGVERSRLIGRHLQMLVTEGRSQVRATVQKVFRLKARAVCNVKIQHAEQPLYLRIEATASRSGRECLTVLIDLTEQRRVEEELKLLNEELERRVQERTSELEGALREQESFSYTVSHDLRSPLRHINGYLSILKEEFQKELPAEASEYIERVCGLSRHMGELIDHLLRLARIARCDLSREKVDLSRMASEIMTDLKESEPQRKVDVAIQAGIVVHADRAMILLVLKNLLENAWKYSSRVENARIEVSKAVVGGSLAVEVRDNGVGFDMAYAYQLFDVFQRLHGKEYGGTGIGLATVKRIVERHGGEVWAMSRVNQGASFYFTLG